MKAITLAGTSFEKVGWSNFFTIKVRCKPLSVTNSFADHSFDISAIVNPTGYDNYIDLQTNAFFSHDSNYGICPIKYELYEMPANMLVTSTSGFMRINVVSAS